MKSENREKLVPNYFSNNREKRIPLTRYADWLDSNNLHWSDSDAFEEFVEDYQDRLTREQMITHIETIGYVLTNLNVDHDQYGITNKYLDSEQA